MAIAGLRILLRADWRDAANTVTLLYQGSGPYIDPAGEVWLGAGLIAGLDAIEQAVNGEAAGLGLILSGIPEETADGIWQSYQRGELIDAVVRIYAQNCDEEDQPVGPARVLYTARVDNMIFVDTVQARAALSQVTVVTVNKFSFRRQPNGAVLSDADQRARSAVLNPGAPSDRFAERVILMQNRTVYWPRFSG